MKKILLGLGFVVIVIVYFLIQHQNTSTRVDSTEAVQGESNSASAPENEPAQNLPVQGIKAPSPSQQNPPEQALASQSATQTAPEVAPELSKNWQLVLSEFDKTSRHQKLHGALRFFKYSKWTRMILVAQDMGDPRYASPEFIKIREEIKASIQEEGNSFFKEMGPTLKTLSSLPEFRTQRDQIGMYYSYLMNEMPSARIGLAHFIERELQSTAQNQKPQNLEDITRSYGLNHLHGPEFERLRRDSRR